jgi:hypothetical protein
MSEYPVFGRIESQKLEDCPRLGLTAGQTNIKGRKQGELEDQSRPVEQFETNPVRGVILPWNWMMRPEGKAGKKTPYGPVGGAVVVWT